MTRPPETCPHCGADVPANARACPECGSDFATGWSDEAKYDNLGLPDENFDYDDFVSREFGPKKNLPRGLRPFWWVMAVVVLTVFVWLLLRWH